MTEQNKKPLTTEQALYTLESMARNFNQAAEHKMRMATALQASATALRGEQQKNAELQKQLDDLKNISAYKTVKGKSFTFLIDGSGSMQGSAIKNALEGMAHFVQMAKTDVHAVLWGDGQRVHPIQVAGANEKTVNLACGSTDIIPAVHYMETVCQATDKKQHFIILSDGDVYEDYDTSMPHMKAFLKACPKATVDFVVMASSNTRMGELAQGLQAEFPAQAMRHRVHCGLPITTILESIYTARTAKKKDAALKKKQPKC